jgi:uncharacterized membrane protein YsdA (DUF1294 family)
MAGTILVSILSLVIVNLFTMLCFREDKQRAVAGERRIPEAHLLGLALIGGSPGALMARRMFRHKTRKQPFSTWLFLIVAIQAGIVIGLSAF